MPVVCALRVRTAILNKILWRTGNQCNCRSSGLASIQACDRQKATFCAAQSATLERDRLTDRRRIRLSLSHDSKLMAEGSCSFHHLVAQGHFDTNFHTISITKWMSSIAPDLSCLCEIFYIPMSQWNTQSQS